MMYERKAQVSAIEASAMDKLRDVVDLIPDVKPLLAMKALKEAVLQGGYGDIQLDKARARLAWRDGWAQLSSPLGAQILVAMFRDGKIDQKPPRRQDISDLEAYAAKTPQFLEAVAVKTSAWEAYEKRLNEIAADPDCARPEEITPELIDEIFIRTKGLARYGVMRIAGLECHKSAFAGQTSNSGKSKGPSSIWCWWIDAEGNRRGQEEPERVFNRRNDPDRNYGLGRE